MSRSSSSKYKGLRWLTAGVFASVAIIHTAEYINGYTELRRIEREDSLTEALQEARWIIEDYDAVPWYGKFLTQGTYISANNYIFNASFKPDSILMYNEDERKNRN